MACLSSLGNFDKIGFFFLCFLSSFSSFLCSTNQWVVETQQSRNTKWSPQRFRTLWIASRSDSVKLCSARSKTRYHICDVRCKKRNFIVTDGCNCFTDNLKKVPGRGFQKAVCCADKNSQRNLQGRKPDWSARWNQRVINIKRSNQQLLKRKGAWNLSRTWLRVSTTLSWSSS